MNRSTGHRAGSLARKRGPEQRLHSRCRTGGIEERQNETSSCDGLPRSAGTSTVAKRSPGRTDSPVDATCSRARNGAKKISWRRHLNTDATQDTGYASGNTSLARKSAARLGKNKSGDRQQEKKSRAKKSRHWTELHGRAGQEQESQALTATQSRPGKTKQAGRNQSKKRKQPAANPKKM
jgi:hypothetical protein